VPFTRKAFSTNKHIVGTLLTFVQFLFVAVTGFIAQFDKNSRFFLTPNKVPISRWIFNIVLFFTINLLNNHAFSYDISVPVHIILRSGGSITTMAAGYLYGKRYTQTQVVAVFLLTLGVILAAWSDVQAKVRSLFRLRRQSQHNTDAFQTIGYK
jgi:UDP-xylose/UDP-N-acetylglucosamine transporter B4